jgi:hypothetical protein
MFTEWISPSTYSNVSGIDKSAMLFLRRNAALTLLLFAVRALAQSTPEKPVQITVQWDNPEAPLRTTPTLQVVVMPPLERGSPIHDASFAAVKELGADYVRYVPWFPYPRFAVAELAAPQGGKTSWDFSKIDPMTLDFLHATEGHSPILNFSTIPVWFYKTEKPVVVPADPDQLFSGENQGRELLDPTCNDVAGYYARLVSWYTQGGFTDELGVRHDSGYHYRIPYWEVFNEIEAEHHFTAEQYTTCYDAITRALHKVDPQMKFVGLALAFPERDAEMFEYFLNPANHKPCTQLDMISYHFYASPRPGESPDTWQYSFFDQADRLLAVVQYIEGIRKRLSPATRTTIDELGSILPGYNSVKDPQIPPIYYSASGALYAYVYIETARLGIDVVGESQLVGFPSQYPDVTMVDWATGRPNARFEVLRLLHDNFNPGDMLFHMNSFRSDIDAAAFENASGVKKLLVVNKRNRGIVLQLPPEFAHGSITTVDVTADVSRPAAQPWSSSTLTLPPFAVTVVSAGK